MCSIKPINAVCDFPRTLSWTCFDGILDIYIYIIIYISILLSFIHPVISALFGIHVYSTVCVQNIPPELITTCPGFSHEL